MPRTTNTYHEIDVPKVVAAALAPGSFCLFTFAPWEVLQHPIYATQFDRKMIFTVTQVFQPLPPTDCHSPSHHSHGLSLSLQDRKINQTISHFDDCIFAGDRWDNNLTETRS